MAGLTVVVLAIIGVVGNALSAAVFSQPQMRSPINILLAGLSLVDAALLVLAVPCIALPSLIQSALLFSRHLRISLSGYLDLVI